tara:strand:- start:861 stop:1112 length:252 start_codon:yes stop_codon:yes gene_type:complete
MTGSMFTWRGKKYSPPHQCNTKSQSQFEEKKIICIPCKNRFVLQKNDMQLKTENFNDSDLIASDKILISVSSKQKAPKRKLNG